MSKLGTRRPTAIVNHVTNLELLGEHQQAVEDLERLNKLTSARERLNNPYTAEIRAAAARVQEIEQEMDDSTVCIKLRALKKDAYAQHCEENPPREGNDVDQAFGINTSTFLDAVMPDSIVEAWWKNSKEKVDFTGADWAEESDEFTDAQLSEFASQVLLINKRVSGVPFTERLRSDPELRREVEQAERLGVSLKRFNGWEPTTTYVYDEAGRLVSSQPEEEWDETQRAWMLSLAEYRASLCPVCGYPREICQAPENADKFTVPPPTRCHATTAIRQFRQSQDAEYPHPEALLWSAILPAERR